MRRHPRGFAAMMAVILIGIVGATFLVMTAAATRDLRRTRDAVESAQLRQLLLAGAVDVAARARGWGEAPLQRDWDIPLPAALKGEEMSLHAQIVPLPDHTADVRVEARRAGRIASQTLHFEREAQQWTVSAASLER